MANYKVLATWDISIQNLYKDITLIQQGISCKLNISLRSISRVTVNYKVGREYVTDLCTIDLENNKVIVPFKKNVLEVGKQSLELVCHMKNGDVLVTPTYIYDVIKSLDNTNDITEEDAYPVLIGMIQELTKNEAIIQANEEARANAEMYRELNEDERQNAEAERKRNENTRTSNENTRKSNENSRQQYEAQRRAEEDERLTDEQVRVNAENIRIANENERLRKEIERQNAEELRQIAYNSSLYARMDEAEGRLNTVDSQLAQKANTRQYGDNDDIVDHTSILKSVFSSSKSVVLDNKEYNVSNKITFENNITIDGNKATIKPLSNIGKGDNISAIYSNRNINISDLTFEGVVGIGDDMDGVHMFDVWDSTNININNCDFKNNTYVGSRYFNCNNVKINNCNYENVDCGIITLGDTAYNFFINNCFFKGHYMSEPIAFYSNKLMKNINIDNCIMEDKSTNAIHLGRENGDLESMVDGFSISNIITKNTTGAIYFSQCKNGTVSNVKFKQGNDYGFRIFSFNYAENINVSNCLCDGSLHNAVVIKKPARNINISNMTIIEPGGESGNESESRFIELYGSNCVIDNIKCISKSSLCDKNIYVFGNNNVLRDIVGENNGSESLTIFLEKDSANNVIINPIGFRVYDKTLNYTTSTTNKVRRDDWSISTTALSDLSYQVYNKFFRTNYSDVNWNIKKISLYAEGESIKYVIRNKYYTDMTLTLGGEGSNIIFKNNDTITLKPNEIIEFEFIVSNNKWVEISRKK